MLFKKWQGCEEIQWRSFIRYMKSRGPGKEPVGPRKGMSEKSVTDEPELISFARVFTEEAEGHIPETRIHFLEGEKMKC